MCVFLILLRMMSTTPWLTDKKRNSLYIIIVYYYCMLLKYMIFAVTAVNLFESINTYFRVYHTVLLDTFTNNDAMP